LRAAVAFNGMSADIMRDGGAKARNSPTTIAGRPLKSSKSLPFVELNVQDFVTPPD
jgi:hypothetical protein